MAVRSASAKWEGTLKEGKGTLNTSLGEHQYSFSTRFEDGVGINPEQLIAAAHSGCFTMALNAALERAGTPADYVQTEAKVELTRGDSGLAITHIELVTEGKVPGIDEATFTKMAEDAKDGCIISQALSAVPMSVTATLVS
ncbi:MAG: OsmC family peroxiredoxin [Anaerolineae bacterium]|nr:OsmC family peroxiredoxin [Anaerolineae bacterium]MCA9887303.1 OsmC family peroxiredoxin [Anaerolineae bacterium]MCA9892410.1 OsmC family peroxiredoxin [Anaerolineae bacterium]MCB9460973.1 OsmC family peroxiredoxin [Anaerolineaceae bacterium]